MFLSIPYTPSLADPSGLGSLSAAVEWLQGIMLGTVATTVAVVAVAAVGFLMLAGRIDWRRGVTVIVGCFVLFGATSIVAGIRGVAGDGVEPPAIPANLPPPPVAPPSPAPAAPYDPYAGASVRP
jgi:type IV secretion system protein VirB2